MKDRRSRLRCGLRLPTPPSLLAALLAKLLSFGIGHVKHVGALPGISKLDRDDRSLAFRDFLAGQVRDVNRLLGHRVTSSLVRDLKEKRRSYKLATQISLVTN